MLKEQDDTFEKLPISIQGSIKQEVNPVNAARINHLQALAMSDTLLYNAVVRSHLIGQLAEQLGAKIFAPEIAYLTAGSQLTSPWLKGYRVLDEMAFDRKKLKAYLKERSIGTLEIKKRGSDIVPEQLRKELAPKGKGAATLIVTRVGDAHRVLICESLK
ncbi:MAG: hypothetical protein RL096_864 [Actinomycetota bacterium]